MTKFVAYDVGGVKVKAVGSYSNLCRSCAFRIGFICSLIQVRDFVSDGCGPVVDLDYYKITLRLGILDK